MAFTSSQSAPVPLQLTSPSPFLWGQCAPEPQAFVLDLLCVCVRVCACLRACVRVCFVRVYVCVCVLCAIECVCVRACV